MKIIAQEHVRGRSLLRNGFQRRMRLEQRHGREPAAVGDASFARAAVVVGNILQQPINCVVGVRAFVNGVRIAAVARRPLHHKRPFGTVAAADILEHEDVAIREHIRIKIKQAREPFVVIAKAVGRSRQEKRERLLRFLWRVDFGVQFHAVAHRNHHVAFCEERSVVRQSRSLFRQSKRRCPLCRWKNRQNRESYNCTEKCRFHRLPPCFFPQPGRVSSAFCLRGLLGAPSIQQPHII